MTLIQNVPFDHEGRTIKTIIKKQDDLYVVRAYKDGTEVNGYEYSVREPTDFDFWKVFGISGVQHLIDNAKDDIVQKRWERYLKALAELEEEKKKAAAREAADDQARRALGRLGVRGNPDAGGVAGMS